MSDKHTPPPGQQGLFVRAPKVEGMRDPLAADWNVPPAGAAPSDDELAALIDFGQMNALFSRFLDVIGLPVAIIDLQGRVLASSRWQRLCLEFHRAEPRTLAQCMESDVSLSRQMAEGKEYALYRCKNGLTDCATPIVVEGRHIANLFIGQFLLAEPDHSFFRGQRERYGFDRAAYEAALKEVPIVDEARLPAILDLIGGVARLIAAQSLAEKRAQADRQNVERLVAERTAELQAANKELESFSYSVSHDLRSPLNLMTGFAGLLMKRHGESLPPEGRELLGHVIDAADRMGRLITDLLSFGRSRHADMILMPVDMNGLVAEVVEELRPGWGEREVVVTVGDLPPVEGDWSMLHQVVTNILSNAVKFTGARPRAEISVQGERVEGKGVYRFSDNGVGFDRANADRIFSVFRRFHTQSAFPGTGVGLALVKRIVERHGGTVEIESAPDRGTTVTVTLPAVREG
ncbi:MAG: PocR ligand-binding domain-containing protein [Nitrospinae bacterium]|nr:PocR ligand-binding domain-containing protein [Nitrospinota bacterium]